MPQDSKKKKDYSWLGLPSDKPTSSVAPELKDQYFRENYAAQDEVRDRKRGIPSWMVSRGELRPGARHLAEGSRTGDVQLIERRKDLEDKKKKKK